METRHQQDDGLQLLGCQLQEFTVLTGIVTFPASGISQYFALLHFVDKMVRIVKEGNNVWFVLGFFPHSS